jgi:hypothetical protein
MGFRSVGGDGISGSIVISGWKSEAIMHRHSEQGWNDRINPQCPESVNVTKPPKRGHKGSVLSTQLKTVFLLKVEGALMIVKACNYVVPAAWWSTTSRAEVGTSVGIIFPSFGILKSVASELTDSWCRLPYKPEYNVSPTVEVQLLIENKR